MKNLLTQIDLAILNLRIFSFKFQIMTALSLPVDRMSYHFFIVCKECKLMYEIYSRYTSFSHTAGTPGDFRSAILVKQQWERLLNLPVTGSTEKLYDAGSNQSRKALTEPDSKVNVWTDTYYVLLKLATAIACFTEFGERS